jgi:hypothetical protein
MATHSPERLMQACAAALSDLDHVERELTDFRKSRTELDRFDVRALGSLLADFYNTVEKLLRDVAREFGEMPEEAEAWHRGLLKAMRAATERRPALLSDDLYEKLLPFLGFRHVFRHAYGFELDPARVRELASQLAATTALLHADVKRFLQRVNT